MTDITLANLSSRASEIDKIAKQLENSINELKPTLSKNKKSQQHKNHNDKILTLADTQHIILKLKSIKSQVHDIQNEREREKTHIAIIKKRLTQELLALKKEQLLSSLKITPETARNYFQQQLLSLRKQIVSLQSKQKPEISAHESNVLKRVYSELSELRKQTAKKFAEFAQYKEWYENWLLVSDEFELSKERIRQRLLLLHGEVQQMHEKNASLEEEIAHLKQENADYKAGRLLPAPFEAQIVSRLQLLRNEVFDVETENKILRMRMRSVQKNENKISDENEISDENISPTFDPLLDIPRKMLITTIDMHTGGEPLRIIENGGPIFSSNMNLLQKRECMINKFDHFRQFLMHEPRGHFDMYGALITECDSFGKENNADFAVLFMHNDGYSVMCGHGSIALGRYAVDFGLCKNRKINEDSNGKKTIEVKFQVPCGIVTCTVQVNGDGRSMGEVSFLSPPAWAEFIKKTVHLEQFGKIELDIGYGGTFYAILPAARFNLNVRESSIDELVHIATMVKHAVQKSSKIRLKHPESKELEFLYGVIFTDGNNKLPSCNVCVFADREVDRSPTGSGVMARLAIDYAKKITKVGEVREFIGKTGSVFYGCIKQVIEEYKGKECAVIVSVTGNANYCGRCVWYLEDGDNLGRGFLLK